MKSFAIEPVLRADKVDSPRPDAQDERERTEALLLFVMPAILSAWTPAWPRVQELSLDAYEPSSSARQEPGSWQTGGNSLTVANAPAQELAADGEWGNDSGRLIAQVDAGELGTVSIVVERRNDGIRLVLGVDNADAQASAALQQTALLQALRATGLLVSGIAITRTDVAGSFLATSAATATDTFLPSRPRGASLHDGERLADAFSGRLQHVLRRLNTLG